MAEEEDREGGNKRKRRDDVRSKLIAISCTSVAILNILCVDKLPETSHGILEVFEREWAVKIICICCSQFCRV